MECTFDEPIEAQTRFLIDGVRMGEGHIQKRQASRYFAIHEMDPLRFRERIISDYYASGCPRRRYLAGARIAPGSTMTLRRFVRLIFCLSLRWEPQS